MIVACEKGTKWDSNADPTNHEIQINDAILTSLSICNTGEKISPPDISLLEEGAKESLKWLDAYGLEYSVSSDIIDGKFTLKVQLENRDLEVVA